MMFADCEYCCNCTQQEDCYFCEVYGRDIEEVNYCEELEDVE